MHRIDFTKTVGKSCTSRQSCQIVFRLILGSSMLHFFELLFGTITYRPYVFVFFALYLFFALTNIGLKRTSIFTVLAFTVAFLCEWSSAVAGTGFPFGLYYYIANTTDKELWIAGVPFMDSLSFTFLSYVSWELAVTLLSNTKKISRHAWSVTFLASFLMMYLDIIIDPVALLGERWFLGKIYYYPNGGSYKGITLANFLGWFFVCTVILRIFALLDRWIKNGEKGISYYPLKSLFPLGLYLGILGFNLIMTFWIGERELGVTGIIIVLPLLGMMAARLSN